ncbi:hypothetical protein [Anaerophaga thermohalophila]|uniref:hypothetical protein n=1 Tax=Anaerophaga thermohalophila TaxID=177400 RepID=UPI000237CA82|nr:hypothetical protein [Anaerophaga thermohalophila]
MKETMKEIMKEMIRIYIIGFLSVSILYVILKLSIDLLLLNEELIDSVERIIELLLFALVFTLFQGFIIIQFLKPKISLLTSDSPIEKRFGNVEEEVSINKQFDFEKFVKSLKNDFVITYSDKNIIKIRDKFKFWSWGAAAMISIDKENNTLKINSFPLNGTPGTKATIDKKSRKLIEKSITKI